MKGDMINHMLCVSPVIIPIIYGPCKMVVIQTDEKLLETHLQIEQGVRAQDLSVDGGNALLQFHSTTTGDNSCGKHGRANIHSKPFSELFNIRRHHAVNA